jgi:hypothetical protein
VSVEYDRFLRLAGPVKLEVQLGADRGATETVLDDAYLEGFDMENVSPQPDSESADARGVVFSFEEETPRAVTISLLAREIGFRVPRFRRTGSAPSLSDSSSTRSVDRKHDHQVAHELEPDVPAGEQQRPVLEGQRPRGCSVAAPRAA